MIEQKQDRLFRGIKSKKMNNEIKGFWDTINWYNANAKQYASSLEIVPNLDLLDRFVSVIGKDQKVLDAGCAGGRDCILLKNRGLKPVGVDLSESLLEIARKKYPDIQFEYANFLNLPFKNKTFDGVWAHASLLHLETTEDVCKALNEFYRVLKQKGIIFISVKQQRGQKKTSVVWDKLSGHKRFFQWFTKEEIRSILEQTGFQIEEIHDEYKDLAGRGNVKWIFALARKRL